MITYYKKIEVRNVDDLCEAIHCSLLESLVNVDSIGVYFHNPSLQIRIRIKYDNSLQINMNINPEDYDYLLRDTAVQADYAVFIIELRNRIREMILKNYIR